MKFLFRKYQAKKGEIIEVGVNTPAIVKFMTAAEFKKYAGSRTHTYFKGREADGTIRFSLPFDNIWHAVVEEQDASLAATSKLCAATAQDNYLDAGSPVIGENREAEIQSISLGSRSEG